MLFIYKINFSQCISCKTHTGWSLIPWQYLFATSLFTCQTNDTLAGPKEHENITSSLTDENKGAQCYKQASSQYVFNFPIQNAFQTSKKLSYEWWQVSQLLKFTTNSPPSFDICCSTTLVLKSLKWHLIVMSSATFSESPWASPSLSSCCTRQQDLA